jgi:hypothetical protein
MDASLPPYAAVAEAAPVPGCNGETIVGIAVHRYGPLSDPDRIDSLSAPAAGARARLIRAYLRLHVGEQCTEVERRESERLLRAQPFVASVSITARADGNGGTQIRVHVIDEWPLLARVGMRDGSISSAMIGTQNLAGLGLRIEPSWSSRPGYRTGGGLRVVQYGLGAWPAFAEVEAVRDPIGGTLRGQVSKPYVTERQRVAWRVGSSSETRYLPLLRPGDEDAAVRTGRATSEASWVARIGSRQRSGFVMLAGASLMRDELRTGDQSVIITPGGIEPTDDSVFANRFRTFVENRAGLVLGARALSFTTVARHHALRAAEDLARGVRVSVFGAPTIDLGWKSGDVLFAGDLFAAAGGARRYVALRAGGETRVPMEGGEAYGRVLGAMLDWRTLPSARRTRATTISFAAVNRSQMPVQMTFRDPDGGLASGSRLDDVGGRRLTVRQEERMLLPWLRSRADLGWAVFADAGRVWKGDVPYGRDSPVRGSVGVSLLAAPRFGKRLLRVDLAVPMNPEPGNGGLVVRVRAADFTNLAWMESRDVSRARTGEGPATLTRW